VRASALRIVFVALLCLAAGVAESGVTTLYSNSQGVSINGAMVSSPAFTPGAGAVTVTVTDTSFPAPLAQVEVAVTQGATVVTQQTATATVTANATTAFQPLTLTFTATAGTAYVIRVVGTPSSTFGAGAAVVSAALAATPTQPLVSFSAPFQIPLPTVVGGQLPVQTLTFSTAGNYTATLTDFGLPSYFPANQLFAALFFGAGLTAALSPGTPTQFTVPSGNLGKPYTLQEIALPATGGGLFGLRITDPNGNLVYPTAASGGSGITAIGGPTGPATFAGPASGASVTLTATDLAFPNALGTLGAVLTSATGAPVATDCVTNCAATNATTGTAPGGSLLLWRAAVAGTGAGSYRISVANGSSASGPTLYTDSETVSPAVAGVTSNAYTLAVPVPAAGSYTATVNDLQAPVPLTGLQFALYQNGVAVSSQASNSGAVTATLAQGTAQLVIIAETNANTIGAGLVGVTVASTGSSPTTVLNTAQPVGTITGAGSVPLVVSSAQAGAYTLALTDAEWPAAFQTLYAFITSGAKLVTSVNGGGSETVSLAAGSYLVTYAAVPSTTFGAGVYALSLSASAPTATFSVTPTSLSSGQSAALTWSSTGATGCTASGGWSGAEPTSGTSVSTGALSKTTSFTLVCSGPGGSTTPQTVTVTVTGTVTPPSGGSSSGGGGGGALDPAALAWLALAGLLPRLLARRARTARP
jgi:hypothetical protein